MWWDRFIDWTISIRMGQRRNLIKRSVLWCIFHHPLKIIIRTCILFIIIGGLGNYFSEGHDFIESDFNFYCALIAAFILAIMIVKRSATKDYRLMEYHHYTPEMIEARKHHPFKKMLEYTFLGAIGVADCWKNSNASDVPPPTMSDVMYSSKHNDTQRRREEEQRARWHAQDMQKKAEWDARDAALRGKDIAARQRQNDANYWRNQARR